MNRKCSFDKLYESDVLKRPMTPSKWVTKDVYYQPITRIKMSCGGGIGGSTWYEYVDRIPLEALAAVGTGGMVFHTFDGKDVLLNMDYIVKAEQFTVACAVLNSENPNFPKGYWMFCYLVEDGHKITLID